MRDYLHVLDLASGHLLALDALAPESTIFDNCPDEARYKAYNLGKGKGMSVLQIVDAQGMLEEGAAAGGWMLWEVAQDFGMGKSHFYQNQGGILILL